MNIGEIVKQMVGVTRRNASHVVESKGQRAIAGEVLQRVPQIKDELVIGSIVRDLTGPREITTRDLERARLFRDMVPGRRPDFYAAKLNGASLPGQDLKNFKMEYVELHGADLSGAKLNKTNFSGGSLDEAQLTNADLRKTILRDTSLARANLKGADLRGADLGRAQFWNADLRDANLSTASGANFYGADLTGAKLPDLRTKNNNFENAYVINRHSGREIPIPDFDALPSQVRKANHQHPWRN